MLELLNEEIYCLSCLCEGKVSVPLWSCLESKMGRAWADNKENPTVAVIIVADFCYLLGSIKALKDELEIKELLEKCRWKIVQVDDSSWVEIMKKYYPNSFKSFNRYSIKREPNVFQLNKLEEYVNAVEGEFHIDRIDENLYFKVIEDKFMADCCSNFSSLEEFLEHGIGYVIVHNGEIISGASSYSYSAGSIEVTIGTKEEFRRKGLALAVASKLILECKKKNIYPGWDAANLQSVALAEKLGYHLDKAYEVYSI